MEIKTASWAPMPKRNSIQIAKYKSNTFLNYNTYVENYTFNQNLKSKYFILKAIFIFIDHLNGRKSVPVRRKTWVLHLMKMETFGRYSTIPIKMETQEGLTSFTCHPELLH